MMEGAVQEVITRNREKIAELCRTHHVRRLSVFGSAVREDFNAETSDIDLLVEFEGDAETIPDYAGNYFDLMFALGELFAKKVDLLTDKYVRNPYLRRAIDADKVMLYAA